MILTTDSAPPKHSVAVIIAAYNAERFIVETLESLTRQTRLPDEVIVVDDGSTDATADVVRRFEDADRIGLKLIVQQNRGIAAARNASVQASHASHICFLDSDDCFYPRFIEAALNVLTRDTDLVVCFSDRDVVDEHGAFMRRDLDAPAFRSLVSAQRSSTGAKLLDSPFVTLLSGSVIPMGNLMLSRKDFERVDGFDFDQAAVEDRLFLLYLSRLGRFGFIDEPLGIWRRHNTNVSGSSNTFAMVFYADQALTKVLDRQNQLELSSEELDALKAARSKIAPRLLYAASHERRPEYRAVVWSLLRKRRISPASAAWSIVRLAQRQARALLPGLSLR